LRRKFAICVRSNCVSCTWPGPQTCRRRDGCACSRTRSPSTAPSRLDSMGVRWTSRPSRKRARCAKSMASPPSASMQWSRVSPLSPPQRGAHPCNKLARRERLGHVVVRAGVQCADLWCHRQGSAASAACAPAPVGRTADVDAQVVDVHDAVILDQRQPADGAHARCGSPRPRRLRSRLLDARLDGHGRSFSRYKIRKASARRSQ
jgi:hypothetical protein